MPAVLDRSSLLTVLSTLVPDIPTNPTPTSTRAPVRVPASAPVSAVPAATASLADELAGIPAGFTGVLLKALLYRRHWQTYRTFCREFDKAAATIDKSVVGTWPSRAQFYRWLSGSLRGLPHPEHCMVLEVMLPGHRADDLFRPVRPPYQWYTEGAGR